MEWSERMNAAIDYLEGNLADSIDFNEAAKKACCSLFHFRPRVNWNLDAGMPKHGN